MVIRATPQAALELQLQPEEAVFPLTGAGKAPETQTRLAIEDQDFILDILAGNRDAYAEIVRKYQGRIRGYCLVTLGNAAQADDAAQEVFIKAYQSLDRFQGKSSLSTWLYRIAVNHCTDLLRKKICHRTESWDALLENQGEKAEALLTQAPEAGSEVEEQRELLAKLLGGLPEKSREILVLREAEGLSYEELAETLDCTVDAVKGRLKRARQELEKKARHYLKQGRV